MGQVIIFSTATGGGHNQVAKVLASELSLAGHSVQVIDYLQAASQFLNALINGSYNNFLSKTGWPYGLIYDRSQRDTISRSVTGILNNFLIRRISAIIEESAPDLIISTHPLIVQTLGELKSSCRIRTPLISIITDFEAHRLYVHPYVDAYIVASWHTGESLHKQGIDPARIHLNGIPVRREFMTAHTSRRSDTFTPLIMGGSHSSGSIFQLLESLVISDENLHIIVVCGTNLRLKQRLERDFICLPDNIKLEVHGYSQEIPSLMERADVIITKPGGVTVSEAINKHLPIVMPYWITGQEAENRSFLAAAGVALDLDKYLNINSLLSRLITRPVILQEMESQMRILSASYSLDRTVCLAAELMKARREQPLPMGF